MLKGFNQRFGFALRQLIRDHCASSHAAAEQKMRQLGEHVLGEKGHFVPFSVLSAGRGISLLAAPDGVMRTALVCAKFLNTSLPISAASCFASIFCPGGTFDCA